MQAEGSNLSEILIQNNSWMNFCRGNGFISQKQAVNFYFYVKLNVVLCIDFPLPVLSHASDSLSYILK